MGIRLIEVKSSHLREGEREFLFKVSTTEHVLHYEELMLDDEKLKEYIEKNPCPKDKYFEIETFVEDLSCECYISVLVEKIETALYIADLIYDLL